MYNSPYAFSVALPQGRPDRFGRHVQRRLTEMTGQFLDQDAFEAMAASGNPVIYEVYELVRPQTAGELNHGLSVVHAGKVGDEYFMTKGHFHAQLERAELYYCLWGEGLMVMETPEGEWAVEELRPGRVLYVPPRWAHRSVNTGKNEDLITLFTYPADAGHDYGTIERQGFRKLIIECAGRPIAVDNPRWRSPEGKS